MRPAHADHHLPPMQPLYDRSQHTERRAVCMPLLHEHDTRADASLQMLFVHEGFHFRGCPDTARVSLLQDDRAHAPARLDPPAEGGRSVRRNGLALSRDKHDDRTLDKTTRTSIGISTDGKHRPRSERLVRARSSQPNQRHDCLAHHEISGDLFSKRKRQQCVARCRHGLHALRAHGDRK